MSTSLNGMRIALVVSGSRGDAQPYIALALELQKEGGIVSIMTNCNHEKFIQDQGLGCAPVFSDSEESMKKPASLEAMKTGDIFKWLKATNIHGKAVFPADIARLWSVLDAFKPEMLLCSVLKMIEAEMYSAVNKIPAIPVFLGIYLFSGEVTPLGIKNPTSLACVNRYLWKLVYKKMAKGGLEKLAITKQKIANHALEDIVIPVTVNEYIEHTNHPICPTILGVSACVYGVPKDVTSPNIHTTGWWILDTTHQIQRFEAGDPAFGGGERDKITAFLKSGSPPVYIGWGSMIAVSAEHMTKLAVSTLQQTKQRGIVLQGWSALAPELLHDEGLKAYAKENVLFIKSAPHEWLLPQCSVSIIHGGSGTTAAALRAGKPTIITPVFLDQYDFANSLTRLNVGVATCQFKNVTTGILAAALTKCLTDGKVSENVQRLSKQLKSEDGVGTAVRLLKEFVDGPLESGEWKMALNARNTRWQKARNRRPFPSCCRSHSKVEDTP